MKSSILITIGFSFLLPVVHGQDGGCTAFSCVDCLNSINCVWFPINSDSSEIGECLETCSAIPDAPCYETDETTSVDMICSTITNEISDWNTCSTAMDCVSCINTVQTDGTTPCLWNNEGGYCGSDICTFQGCGTDTCDNAVPVAVPTVPTDVVPTQPSLSSAICNTNATSCEECLTDTTSGGTETTCAWVVDQCVDSCSVLPGLICFSASQYPSSTVSDICALIDIDGKDDAICNVATNCDDCTALVQSDTVTSCLWFQRSDSDVIPYCGAWNTTYSIRQVSDTGIDLKGVVGISDCSKINETLTGSTLSPSIVPGVAPPTTPTFGFNSNNNNTTPTTTTSATSGLMSISGTQVIVSMLVMMVGYIEVVMI